jgi:hypothetical protein
MRWTSNRAIFPLALGWLAVGVAGLVVMARHQFKAGPSSAMASDWPATTPIIRPEDQYFLLVFVHPKCDCSQATVAELNKLMARCNGKLTATVLFVRPADQIAGWEKGSLWKAANAIPNVQTFCDAGGLEARRFLAATSGQTFLFDPSGKLIFRGGITDGRGHEGDNAGSDAIEDLVHGKTSKISQTPVFGCELFDPMSIGMGGATWVR